MYFVWVIEWWLCGVVVVSLAQGLRSQISSPTLEIFHLPPTSPTSPPRDLAFAGVQIQGLFSWNSNGPGGTSGAHTTCCEERPVLPTISQPGSRSFACMAHSACLVHRHPGSARCASLAGCKRIWIAWAIAQVIMPFRINSTSNVIEIARGKAKYYFNCFTSAIDP